jgi:phosphatidylserine/phosphatidylglycerophosphate/cardiolipin synthase-like enzyme
MASAKKIKAKKTPAKRAASKTAKKAPKKTKTRTVAKKASAKPKKPAPKKLVSKPIPVPAPTPSAASSFEVTGTNDKALFTLKLHRGEGMCLVAMNWKSGRPTDDFVGFGIEYRPPGANQFYALNNRLGFLQANGAVSTTLSTLQSPIQKFRWIHFPSNASLTGDFLYRVTPMFMDAAGKLTSGEQQSAAIQLARETYPGVADVTFTRGFISSQAFVDRYQKDGPVNTLVAPLAAKGLDFVPTHKDAATALPWMGFEARAAILEVLDQAIADKADVRVVAYDFNLPEVVDRLEKLGPSLKIIIDNSGSHGNTGSAENEAEQRLIQSAGAANVKRQHMGSLQHNKTITVNGPTVKKVVCGSTNLSWRGFYVQSNNALILTGQPSVDLFTAAFDTYFKMAGNAVADFNASTSATWASLGLTGVDAQVTFSPHSSKNAALAGVAADLKSTTSSLLYSLAFLYEVPGAVTDAIKTVTADDKIFVYGISDKQVGGIDVQDPKGNVDPVYFTELTAADTPAPFKPEDSGGGGVHLHHKFTVIDFDKPTARVYLGSYNFSNPADTQNGENLVLVKNRRIAVAFMVEALSMFDHYSFRVALKNAKTKTKTLSLAKPPAAGEKPWFDDDFTAPHKIKDRELFS